LPVGFLEWRCGWRGERVMPQSCGGSTSGMPASSRQRLRRHAMELPSGWRHCTRRSRDFPIGTESRLCCAICKGYPRSLPLGDSPALTGRSSLDWRVLAGDCGDGCPSEDESSPWRRSWGPGCLKRVTRGYRPHWRTPRFKWRCTRSRAVRLWRRLSHRRSSH
jgi:hypothetical protein